MEVVKQEEVGKLAFVWKCAAVSRRTGTCACVHGPAHDHVSSLPSLHASYGDHDPAVERWQQLAAKLCYSQLRFTAM